MVRISSKISPKKKPSPSPTPPKSIEINSNSIDQTSSSSSKILHVVRQALLNAAEELVSQQEKTNPFHTLDINENAKKKKKLRRK